MNRRDYEATKKSLDQAHASTVAAADDRYNAAMEALETLWSLAGEGASAAAPASPRRGPGRPRKAASGHAKPRSSSMPAKKAGRRRGRPPKGKGTLIDSMRTAVTSQRGNFTIADIKSTLSDRGVSLNKTNPAVLSTTMKRLEQLGEIKIVKRGRGRRASIYKKG